MKIVLNSIKVIGLILLSLVCNIIPMYLLQYQNKLSLPAKWGLGLVYIVLIILVIYFLWQAHKKHDSAEVATQKMTCLLYTSNASCFYGLIAQCTLAASILFMASKEIGPSYHRVSQFHS